MARFTGLRRHHTAIDVAILRHGKFTLTPVGIVGFAFFLAGLSFYGVAHLTLGKFFSERVRIIPEHKLITKGPYRIIRHPIYLGEILYALSIPMILGSLYGFVVTIFRFVKHLLSSI